MTLADAGRLIAIIVTAYPNSDKYRDKREVDAAVALWADFFADDDERIVALAVKKHIATNKWPPAIAEIREIMASIQHPDIIPADEAWEAVTKMLYAVGEHCYSDIYKLLPQTIAEAVDAIGYGLLYALHVAYARGNGGKAGLDRLAFTQAYEPKVERQRQRAMTPPALRKRIQAAEAAFTDGSRGMLAEVNRLYEDKKRQNERIGRAWMDDYNALEERRLMAIAERATEQEGDEI